MTETKTDLQLLFNLVLL